MTAVLIDTSVVIKWFHDNGETEFEESRAVLAAHHDDLVEARILDLTLYELGNVLIRALRWSADDTADQIDDLLTICGPPLVPDPPARRAAADLAHLHKLSYYDAAFAATAQALGMPLLTSDRRLLAVGLGESPVAFITRIEALDR